MCYQLENQFDLKSSEYEIENKGMMPSIAWISIINNYFTIHEMSENSSNLK